MSERRPEDLTILVVEDYEDTSLAMRLALEHKGYHILEASDGEQAVRAAARVTPFFWADAAHIHVWLCRDCADELGLTERESDAA